MISRSRFKYCISGCCCIEATKFAAPEGGAWTSGTATAARTSSLPSSSPPADDEDNRESSNFSAAAAGEGFAAPVGGRGRLTGAAAEPSSPVAAPSTGSSGTTCSNTLKSNTTPASVIGREVARRVHRIGSNLGKKVSMPSSNDLECTVVRSTRAQCGDATASSYTLPPPITNTCSTAWVWCGSDRVASAASNEAHTSTPPWPCPPPPLSEEEEVGGSPSEDRTEASGLRLRTTLRRPGNGLNFGGIDSKVLRPITTAFTRPGTGDGIEVARLKNAMSVRRRHGRVPPLPIPRDLSVAATMISKGLNLAA
mmetsp:Transcript_34434/g.68393  ORF Transcript_34434/g.68393 Transcript_34434/m.68393 type:complete len:310 (+) Transcript_34434:1145-2074(+)